MREIVMKKLQRITLAVASATAVVTAGLGIAAATASAQPAVASHASQPATRSWGGGEVKANECVVEAFLQDVINGHHGNHVAKYLNSNAAWTGGTVGTVPGRANVSGLFAGVVAAFPDAHIVIDDIFGQGDQVVVRVVVSGTQKGAVLGIPASGRHVSWDGVDVYRLSGGKISNIWAGDDWTAILADTGTYKAPWIK
jgi:predicted ester cyclase